MSLVAVAQSCSQAAATFPACTQGVPGLPLWGQRLSLLPASRASLKGLLGQLLWQVIVRPLSRGVQQNPLLHLPWLGGEARGLCGGGNWFLLQKDTQKSS